MTHVAILPEENLDGRMIYRAVAGDVHSLGRTAGEALDRLTRLLPANQSQMMIVVRNEAPARLFAEHRQV